MTFVREGGASRQSSVPKKFFKVDFYKSVNKNLVVVRNQSSSKAYACDIECKTLQLIVLILWISE